LNEYDDLLAAGDARGSLTAAAGHNPDEYARARRASEQTGLPLAVSLRNLPAVEQKVKLNEYDQMMQTAPAVARQMRNPDVAGVAQDDIPRLAQIEQLMRDDFMRPQSSTDVVNNIIKPRPFVFGPIAKPPATAANIATGLAADAGQTLNRFRQGVRLRFADALGLDDMRDEQIRQRREMDFASEVTTPEFDSSTASGIYSGAQSLIRAVPGIAAGVATRNPYAGLAVIGAQTETDAYAKYRERGATPGQATIGSVGEAAVEVGTEMLPMGFLVNRLGKAGAGEFLSGLLLREIPGEQIATLVQDAIDTAVANPGKTWAEYRAERPDAAYQTLVATVTMAGAMGGINVVANRLAGEQEQAGTTDQAAKAMQRLFEVASESTLRTREPATFAQMVQAAAEETGQAPTEVFVDGRMLADAFAQSGIDPAQAMPAIAGQLQDAIAQGHDVAIPIGELAAALPGTGMEQSLLENIRFQADGPTVAEAREFESKAGEMLRTEADRIIGEQQDETAAGAQAQTVFDGVLGQLNAANRFTPDVNQAYATLVRDYFTTMAARMGTTPDALYERFPLSVSAQGVGGGIALDQGDVPVTGGAGLDAVRQQWQSQGIDFAISESPDRITVSKIVVPEGSRGQGAGTRAMQQLIDQADAAGKAIVLSPSADFGGDKKRLTAFYKKLGFKENKGRNRAFSTTESMYREAPGKPLYQSPTSAPVSIEVDGVIRPATNSNGQRIAQTEEGLRNFWRWFGDSKVVDADGRPLVVYHGTGEKFSRINLKKGAQGLFWFASDRSAIEAGEVGASGNGFIMELYAKIENPADWKQYDQLMLDEFKSRGLDGAVLPEKDGAMTGFIINRPTQIKSATGNRGTFDPADASILKQGARGAFDPSSLNIALLENADLSTFLHEAGHAFLEMTATMAAQPEAPEQVQQDMRTLLDWMGFRGGAAEWLAQPVDVRRAGHEKFAESFEQYLFEGTAPTIELQALFSRFRAWLKSVYRSLEQFLRGAQNAGLSPEVRAVMDRMIATDEAIAETQKARAMVPLFKTIEDAQAAGMSAEEFDEYARGALNAQESAKDALQLRGMRDMKWLSNARSKVMKALQKGAAEQRKAVRAEVEAEVAREPVYVARAFIARGELPERDLSNAERRTIDAAAGMSTKLSLPALKEMYGEDPAAPWRYLPVGKNGLAATEGMHPDEVARIVNIVLGVPRYQSGDQMVRELLAAPAMREVIEERTDQTMLERYGDITGPEALARAADEAVHSEARAKMISTELAAIRGMMPQRNLLLRAIRQAVDAAIASRRVRDMKPAQFAAAEARAGRDAEKSLAAGDTERAAQAKQDQLFNNVATKAAYEAQAEIESAVRYFNRMVSPRIRKSIDPDYADQIDAMLERFDLRKGVTLRAIERRKSLAAWIESMREQGIEPQLDERLENEAFRKSYKDMSMEELRGLVDAVKQIEHLGRLKSKLLTARDQRDFRAAVDAAATSIRDNARQTLPDRVESNTFGAKFGKGVRQFFAMHRKLASVVREMDGIKDGGVLWDLFVRPMNERGDAESVMREQVTMALFDLYKPILEAGRLRQKMVVPGTGISLSREGRLAIALNWGNETNRRRVMEGDGWNQYQAERILSSLTREEWQFVEGVWEYIDSFWPQIAEKERRVTGSAPEKVAAAPFSVTLADGTTINLRGGYYPIKYDADRSTRSMADEAAEVVKQQLQGGYARATTRRGHTKARTESVNRPVRKDLNVITDHLAQVTHDLAWHEWLIDANRLINAAPIDTAMREHYGPEFVKLMRDAIRDIAVGEPPAQNVFERGINHLRVGATIAGLGWNLMTSLMQPLGLTQSIVRIGAKHVGRGMMDLFGEPAKMNQKVAWVYEQSDFMRLRGKTMQREINEIRNTISASGFDWLADTLPKTEAARRTVADSYFMFIAWAQRTVDLPTWLGAYHKALDGGEQHDRAVSLADQAVVDSQGGGMVKDLAGIQRGSPMLKLWTNFYSFFNTTYNLSIESAKRTDFSQPSDVARLAMDYLLLYTVPTVIITLMKTALTGDDDDWEPEKLADKLAREQLNSVFGTVVGARELAAAFQGYTGYSGPAGTRFFAEFARLGKQLEQGEPDGAFFKALNNSAGVLLHYPSGAVNRAVSGVMAISEGEVEGVGMLTAPLFGPPRKQ